MGNGVVEELIKAIEELTVAIKEFKAAPITEEQPKKTYPCPHSPSLTVRAKTF